MRKSIYKIAAILLSSSILLSFSGCGKSELDDVVYVDETNVDDNVSDELSDGASSNNNEFNNSTEEKLNYGNSHNSNNYRNYIIRFSRGLECVVSCIPFTRRPPSRSAR